jgi:lantibiotic modifying enzyme
MGGTIAAAYLLKAVDCHRDNVIASGEQPVLVDVDALWHVSPLTKTQSPRAVLYRTGFFPNSNRHSLQSRSSVLGPRTTGKHLAPIGSKPLEPALHQREIVRGFTKAWHCLLGTPRRRAVFLRRLRRIRTQDRRWIYWATAQYAAIRQASLQPAVLRNAMERRHVIARLCRRETVSSAVLRAEINALERLDIPYFVRRTQEQLYPDNENIPQDLIKAIQDVFYFKGIS